MIPVSELLDFFKAKSPAMRLLQIKQTLKHQGKNLAKLLYLSQ